MYTGILYPYEERGLHFINKNPPFQSVGYTSFVYTFVILHRREYLLNTMCYMYRRGANKFGII